MHKPWYMIVSPSLGERRGNRYAYLLALDYIWSPCEDRLGISLSATRSFSKPPNQDPSNSCKIKMARLVGAFRRREDVHFALKNSPEMFRASHLTMTIFCPLSNCLATVLAKRPRRCPLPSMITYVQPDQSQLRPTSNRGSCCRGWSKVRLLTTFSKVDILPWGGRF